ncbi:MAG: UvrD-helicase domain-containing protein, partial [Sphaerochaetaceae bacterium]|nr:UvrD-helicase domain-containing protein [Sphaerochaetaceae bacterium]
MIKKYLCLKASAGSGKTFALSVRYISLMLLGAKPNEILTLTFTNKAANEMKERIFNTLFTLGDDKIYLDEIIRNTGLDEKVILGKKPYMLESFISSELAIYTIDKFVNKILREFSGYAGINDDFEIKEDKKLELTYKFLDSLDKKQFDDFVEFFSYESKKFDSLIDIFKSLIEKNESYDPVYLEAASIDLQKERVLEPAYKIKEYILNQEKASKSALKAVDFNDFETLMDKSKTWALKESIAEFSYFKKFTSPMIEEVFLEFRNQLSIYYHLRSSYALYKFFTLFKSFEEFRKKYISAGNYLEFSDIANITHKLLSTNIDKEFLYFRLDAKYEHILIDEFQDTSVLQFKILKPLIDEVISGKGIGFKTFFYVGDTKQSIYRFRGGRSELFDYVSNSYEKLEVSSLNTNYRSCANVIEFVNETFLKLPAYEYEKQLFNKTGGYVEVFNSTKFGSDEEFEDIALKIDELLK